MSVNSSNSTLIFLEAVCYANPGTEKKNEQNLADIFLSTFS